MKRHFLKLAHVVYFAICFVCAISLTSSLCHAEPCKGDFDNNGMVDGSDLADFSIEFGDTDCPPKALSPVPKTGQTTCYNELGYEINCSGTGQDGDIQAGVSWPNPRFTDNDDGTVTDNLTRLMWLKDANCIQTNYPEFANDGTTGNGRVTWQNGLDFVAGINAGTYSNCGGGHTDWRLPNRFELESLLDLKYVYPLLPNTAGTGKWEAGDPFSNVQSSYYWSATTCASSTNYAWIIGMDYGYVRYCNKSGNQYVWPVRAGQ